MARRVSKTFLWDTVEGRSVAPNGLVQALSRSRRVAASVASWAVELLAVAAIAGGLAWLIHPGIGLVVAGLYLLAMSALHGGN